MKPLPQEPAIEDFATLRGLVKSIACGMADGLRRNRVAAALALLTFTLATALALNSEFDERPRYREFILPDLIRIEARFLTTMRYADRSPRDDWRLFHFITAHNQLKDVIRTAKGSWPASSQARKAHADFIRYYDSLDEEFAIIRTEMSLNEELDYLAAWKEREQKLRPLRNSWESWLN